MINLSEFHSYVSDRQSNICQVAVIQNGKTIINDTWNNYKANDTVHTMSVTKSVVSLLVGIAALDFFGGRRGITGEFQYSTLGIHIFTGIIAVVSKMTTVDFANKYLFEPLMIAPRKIYVAPDAEAHKAFTVGKTPKGNIWFSDEKGVGSSGCCLFQTDSV